MKCKLKSPKNYPKELHVAIISELLKRDSVYSYTGLYLSIKEIAKSKYIKLGINKAKQFARYYYDEAEFIIKKDSGLYLVKPL